MSPRLRLAMQGLYVAAAVCLVGSLALVLTNRAKTTVSIDQATTNNASAVAQTTAGEGAGSGGDTSATDQVDLPDPTATAQPTAIATPTPMPTPTPLPVAFDQAIGGHSLADQFVSPIQDCDGYTPAGLNRRDSYRLTCADARVDATVVAAAPGRVVHVVTEAPIELTWLPDELPSRWSWHNQSLLGTHIVVDHGPLGQASNVQTVYAGLNEIASDISLGSTVESGQPIGVSRGVVAGVDFSIWSDGVRQDGVATLESLAPDAQTQLDIATALGAATTSPTDDRCPLVLFNGQLPGAPRNYRNGTHRGIDFGCGASDRSATAIADGTVVYVVDDYQDATPPDRQALLDLAAIADITPHWTLVMLYGNVVIIDHGVIEGAGRVVTIAAHLESVSPTITLGSRVANGEVLGEIGNRGTLAAAQGVFGANDPSLHLHWELYVDGWFLGQGLEPSEVRSVIAAALCGAEQTAGC